MGCDTVFHLAAQSNVMGALDDPDYSFESNVIGTYNVLKAASIAGVGSLVFSSSREVYGEPLAFLHGNLPVNLATRTALASWRVRPIVASGVRPWDSIVRSSALAISTVRETAVVSFLFGSGAQDAAKNSFSSEDSKSLTSSGSTSPSKLYCGRSVAAPRPH